MSLNIMIRETKPYKVKVTHENRVTEHTVDNHGCDDRGVLRLFHGGKMIMLYRHFMSMECIYDGN